MSHPPRVSPGDPVRADDWNGLARRAEQSVGDGSIGEQSFGATGGTWTPPRRYQAMLAMIAEDAEQMDGPCDGWAAGPVYRTTARQLVATDPQHACLTPAGDTIVIYSPDALTADDIVIAVYDVGTARWWAFVRCAGGGSSS